MTALQEEILAAPQKPRHIAIIMDGNGRWAKAQSLERIEGHKQGVKTVKQIVEAAGDVGLEYLTLYTFSTENWNRPKEEVAALMGLIVDAIIREMSDLVENNVRVQIIGNIYDLPENVRRKLHELIKNTAANKGLTLVLALSYSSKWEILRAVQNIAEDFKEGKIESMQEIDSELFDTYLSTTSMPNPDMVIRTGGEYRLSNFLLWQSAYSELFFVEKYWPDFTKEDLYKLMIEYMARERRYGKTSEQVKTNEHENV